MILKLDNEIFIEDDKYTLIQTGQSIVSSQITQSTIGTFGIEPVIKRKADSLAVNCEFPIYYEEMIPYSKELLPCLIFFSMLL